MKPAILAALAFGIPACERHNPAPVPPDATPAMNQPAAPTPGPDVTKPESLIGADVKTAGEAADRANIRWRIIEEDGQPRPATMDYRPDRLNFTVEKGKIIRVNKG